MKAKLVLIGLLVYYAQGTVPGAVNGSSFEITSQGALGSAALSSGSSALGWSAMFDGTGKLEGFSFVFTEGGIEYKLKGVFGPINNPFRSWPGYVDGVAATGTMFMVVDSTRTRLLAYTYSGGSQQHVLDISVNSGDLSDLGFDVTSPTLSRCVCFPGNANGTCTIPRCDSSNPCGSGGGCMYRNLPPWIE